MKNNEENRRKLALSIIEGWDLDMLREYATVGMVEFFEENEKDFKREWNYHFEKEETR